MIVLDPGHRYILELLDVPKGHVVPGQTLQFVKREGPKYPGNVGTGPGVLIQEVLRACIDRCIYLNLQDPCWQTRLVILLLRRCIYIFENRTRERRGELIILDLEGAQYPWDQEPTCPICGHIRCEIHK